MARVATVDKARKSPGKCGKCGQEIPAGAGYRHWSPGFRGGKRIRCLNCPTPRASETTGNDKLATCYGAGEAVEDALDAFQNDGDIEALRGAVEEAAGQVREAAEMYRESQQNIEDGFQHATSQSDELGEKADNLESKADEMESAASDLEEFEFDEAGFEGDTSDPEGLSDEDVQEEFTEEQKAIYEAGSDEQKQITLAAMRAELKHAYESELKKAEEAAEEEWKQEQADKVSDFTDISPD
jgi:hypothetical protein